MHASFLRVGLLTAALAIALPAHLHAAETDGLPGAFSGNVAFVSDYIIRGISLSDQDPAIQGGLDWESGTGVFAGIWGSSVEFGNDASAEIDFFTGYRGHIDAFHYEVGATYYWYPQTTVGGQSFWDVHADAGYDFGPATATLGLAYTTDDFGPLINDQTLYYSADISVPIAKIMTVSGGIGYSAMEARENYTNWNAGITFNVYDWFGFDVRYHDTNYVHECGTYCDSRVVVKVSRAF